MKRIVCLIILALLLAFAACSRELDRSGDGEKYSMNVSYSLGGDSAETNLSFDAYIHGDENDIRNIDVYEVLINTEYIALLSENGSYNSERAEDYIRISGNVVFDNIGMTKEEIDAVDLFEGIKIIDKDGNEFELGFNPGEANIK